jgi:hypothetical protein
MVDSIVKSRNDGTGPVARALRELIALPLTVLRTLAMESTIACGTRLVRESAINSELSGISQSFPIQLTAG